MQKKDIFVGIQPFISTSGSVSGEIVTINNEKYYKISNYNLMPPFFMNIVSDSDLWMFISSNGALTAGRRNPDNALFPYYTDDKIHDSGEITGSKTILHLTIKGKTYLWEPFSGKCRGIYKIQRNIYKNIVSNHLILEEINSDLNVTFKYEWLNSDKFGFIKKSHITNDNSDTVLVNILDGIQNILPADVDQRMQAEYSTLVDGYKKSELQEKTGLALYMLSSIPTDKAEPSESLRANIVWSTGLIEPLVLLSSNQLDLFRYTGNVKQQTDIKGERGAYLLVSEFELKPAKSNQWFVITDVNKDYSDFQKLSHFLTKEKDIISKINTEIKKDTQSLKLKIAQSDGFQQTSDFFNIFRHCSNTLFNIMRGGIFDNGYFVDKNDLKLFIRNANKQIASKYDSFINDLPDQLKVNELINHVSKTDPTLERLCYEYLPLTFSRRHGDPSRPWNRFSIDVKDEHGNKKLDYQGNWRDIFQNWEALALSYPDYIEKIIVKFVNASTADGYNPYRVTRDGFDWEVIDPADPWSYIGYWGDHQIIYLLKLLELSQEYHPERLQSLLEKKIFTYANVPYKIKPYADIIKDPHNTIVFDAHLDEEIEKKVLQVGSDGKFLYDQNNEIIRTNLFEKLLIPLLVKFSNFIPEAGIWMNTQRPEWNDANNAIVGYGTSMVTLYYMRRYVDFTINLFNGENTKQFEVSQEVFEFFKILDNGFEKFTDLLTGSISDINRKKFLDHFCQAGSEYRVKIYKNGFSGKKASLKLEALLSFLQKSQKYIDHSISANKRDDDLYHAYNLISFKEDGSIRIRYLYEMLEGQVAVLSSGYLSIEDSIILLNSLRKSSLYRKDQSSYILYPNRELPRFTEKNIIKSQLLQDSGLADKINYLSGNDILNKDISGDWHFSSKFRNARFLKEALIELSKNEKNFSDDYIKLTLDLYESVFDHQSFTGRSGTFYKYEGLGSIYWHMVSKLLLALQETLQRAENSGANNSMIEKLTNYYYEIRMGIGSHKNPQLYGAFPTDAYSHTPSFSGAQQPGMTGQVKEDFISRFGELGVTVNNGKLRFNPFLLKNEEFLSQTETFEYFDNQNNKRSMVLNQGMLAFTICQVPVIYIKSNEQKVIITNRDGSEEEMNGLEISLSYSRSIFQREDQILKIRVLIKDLID